MAETTRLIFETLLAAYPDYYEVYQVGLFHCYAVTEPKWPIYPTKTVKNQLGQNDFSPCDRFGQETFREVLDCVKPDITFAYNDPQNLEHLCDPRDKREHKLIVYTNVDGFPFLTSLVTRLGQADLVFTASRFSAEVLKACCPQIRPDIIDCIYAPADTNRFIPVTEQEKSLLQQDLLPPWMNKGAFVLGWVGRNHWRKQIWILYKVLHYLRTGMYLICQACGKISLIDWDPSRQCHLDREKTILESRPGYQLFK
jgi:glycosyltransferase involved in cell wall biosynthesis